MARATISGLTIAIGANTKGFTDAIKEVNRVSKNIASDLKTVSQSLTLDPTAIQVYSQKFKLLQEAVDNSAKKVSLAKKAIEALNKDLDEKKISPEDYSKSIEALNRQLESAKYEYEKNVSAIRNYEKAVKDAIAPTEEVTSETDKQTDSVKKAHKAYTLFYEQTSKAKNGNKELSDSVEKAHKTYTVFYEEAGKAVKTLDEYADEVKQASSVVDSLGDEQKETNQQVENFSDATNEGTKGAFSLGDAIKAHLTSAVILSGLQKLWDLAKGAARALVDAGKKLFNFAKDTVSVAAQYEDALGYSKKVFGAYAENVQEWVKNNSEFLRINISDLQVYANNLGTAFSALGLKREDAVEFSKNLITLSADIRAATGKDIDEIVNALTRGFTSSTRNFRQFGLFIGEADIKIQALKDNIVAYSGDQEELNRLINEYSVASAHAQEMMNAYSEDSDQFREADEKAKQAAEALNAVLGDQEVTLTSSQRAVALYNLVMERLGFLQGQNKDEAGLYNSQIALLNTKFANLRLTIGEKLLPVFTELVTSFNEFLSSEAGQEILADIVAQFEKWGKTVQGWVEDGTIEQFFSNMGERIPQIVEGLGDFVNKIIELVPEIEKLIEALLKFFGIETEAEKTKRTFKSVKKAVQDLADQYGLSLEEMNQAVNLYAETNDLKTSDVYENWDDHKDKIAQTLTTIAQNYDTSLTTARDTIDQFAQKNGVSLDTIYTNWTDYEPKIKQYAETLGTDYSQEFSTALQHLESFATENDLTVSQILSDWQTYEPQINVWLGQMTIDAGQMSEAWETELNKLPESAQNAIRDTSNTNLSPLENFFYRVGSSISSHVDAIVQTFNRLKAAAESALNWVGSKIESIGEDGWRENLSWEGRESALSPNGSNNNGQTWTPYAKGGFARAGQFLRVNDDAGHRLEGFVPFTDGYVMNGNQMDRIVNNNNQRSVGSVNIFVNSYGTNVAEVADELGAAFENRLRISGAML